MTTNLKEITTLLSEPVNGTRWVGWEEMQDKGSTLGSYTVVEVVGIENTRWTQTIRIIIEGDHGDFYSFYYGSGLTEYQENEYYDDVKEVFKNIKLEPITYWLDAPVVQPSVTIDTGSLTFEDSSL